MSISGNNLHQEMSAPRDLMSIVEEGEIDLDQDQEEETGEQMDRDTEKSELLQALRANNDLLRKLTDCRGRSRTRKGAKRTRSPSSSSSSSSSSSYSPSPHRSRCTEKKRTRTTPETRCQEPKHKSDEIISSGEDLERDIIAPSPPAQDDTGTSMFDEALREFEVEEDVGDPISEGLAKLVERRFSQPLKDGKLREKISLYKRPGNCKTLATPMTNEEIWKSLPGTTKRVDVKMTNIQKNVAKATIAICKTADIISKSGGEMKQQMIPGLTDALALLGHTQQALTKLRLEAQRPSLPYDIRGICDKTVDPSDSSLLYGEDVKRSMKEARENKRLTSTLRQNYGYAKTTFRNNAYSNTKAPFLGRRHNRPYGSFRQKHYPNQSQKQAQLPKRHK